MHLMLFSTVVDILRKGVYEIKQFYRAQPICVRLKDILIGKSAMIRDFCIS